MNLLRKQHLEAYAAFVELIVEELRLLDSPDEKRHHLAKRARDLSDSEPGNVHRA